MARGNRQSTRNVVPDKEDVIDRVLEARVRGDCNRQISAREGIAWITCEKYYKEGLRRTGLLEDIELVIKRERMRIDRAYDKCTRDYLAGKCKATEFVAMAVLFSKYNGLDRHLDAVTPEIAPPLMRLEISQVPFELPPDKNQPTGQQE